MTEKLAGVQSGLVVQTTATYDEASSEFILNTPHEGARKNWISQGFVADKAVVLADLIVKGESKGPHAFVMDFRQSGSLVPNVTIDDMGTKTVGNDLDNAWIDFTNVRLPKDSLLRRYAEVDGDGEYQIKGNVRPFDMIGQRLYTGRIAVAQAALEYRRTLYAKTKGEGIKFVYIIGFRYAILTLASSLFSQLTPMLKKCSRLKVNQFYLKSLS